MELRTEKAEQSDDEEPAKRAKDEGRNTYYPKLFCLGSAVLGPLDEYLAGEDDEDCEGNEAADKNDAEVMLRDFRYKIQCQFMESERGLKARFVTKASSSPGTLKALNW